MLIVIPCDFTPVAEAALEYVTYLEAFHPLLEIHLLHVVDSGQEIAKAEEELKRLAKRYSAVSKSDIKCVVCEGKISTEIPGYAEEVHADLVIMGIHETKGIAQLFASKAVKVIADSNIPFLVVQKPPTHSKPFERILMPLGANNMEKGKFEWAVRNAKLYGSHIFVLTEAYNDSGLVAKRDGNVLTMKEVFDSNAIQYTIIQAEKNESFKSILFDLAQKKEIDLFLIMLTQTIGPMLNSTDQQILINPLGIPVLCINPSMIS